MLGKRELDLAEGILRILLREEGFLKDAQKSPVQPIITLGILNPMVAFQKGELRSLQGVGKLVEEHLRVREAFQEGRILKEHVPDLLGRGIGLGEEVEGSGRKGNPLSLLVEDTFPMLVLSGVTGGILFVILFLNALFLFLKRDRYHNSRKVLDSFATEKAFDPRKDKNVLRKPVLFLLLGYLYLLLVLLSLFFLGFSVISFMRIHVAYVIPAFVLSLLLATVTTALIGPFLSERKKSVVLRKESDVHHLLAKAFPKKAVRVLLVSGNEFEIIRRPFLITWRLGTDLFSYLDDKDRPIVKSDGSYTYFMPDIAYHYDKLSRGYDLLIDMLGADHHGYLARMKSALMMKGYPESILEFGLYQIVRVYRNGVEVKMSKRTGKAVAHRDLVAEVGKDAVRYFFTERSGDTHLDFNLDLALSKSKENPVYYSQYAYARCHSLLTLAEPLEPRLSKGTLVLPLEGEILKQLASFPAMIEAASEQRAPHKVAGYVYRLASLVHEYYASTRIIDREKKELTESRLALLKAASIVIKEALRLLGVSAPEKM